LGTGYKKHATSAGNIIIGKYGVGNREQIDKYSSVQRIKKTLE
jgi:hypothetical protein